MKTHDPHTAPQRSPTREGEVPFKNFTPHQSGLTEEGRRNRPKNPSPKKNKKRRAAEHIRDSERKAEAGALAPFFPEDVNAELKDRP
jgi:hypothetical protein